MITAASNTNDVVAGADNNWITHGVVSGNLGGNDALGGRASRVTSAMTTTTRFMTLEPPRTSMEVTGARRDGSGRIVRWRFAVWRPRHTRTGPRATVPRVFSDDYATRRVTANKDPCGENCASNTYLDLCGVTGTQDLSGLRISSIYQQETYDTFFLAGDRPEFAMIRHDGRVQCSPDANAECSWEECCYPTCDNLGNVDVTDGGKFGWGDDLRASATLNAIYQNAVDWSCTLKTGVNVCYNNTCTAADCCDGQQGQANPEQPWVLTAQVVACPDFSLRDACL